MFTKLFLTVLLGLALTGCATPKQMTHPYVPEAPQQTAEPEIQEAHVTYGSPIQKTAVAPVGKLSSKQVQTALKNAGYYQGAIDGKVGPKTKAAIKEFQKANGLKADGVVGKKTSAALNQYLTQ
jgi:peptidoglycan hydrolase-like protein with peptidoglycan-binding domain